MCFTHGQCDGLDSMRRANPISEGVYVKGDRHVVNIMHLYVLYIILRCVCTVHTVGITRVLKVKHMYGKSGMCVIFSGSEESTEAESRLPLGLWINPANMCADLAKQCPWIERFTVPLTRLCCQCYENTVRRKKERLRICFE